MASSQQQANDNQVLGESKVISAFLTMHRGGMSGSQSPYCSRANCFTIREERVERDNTVINVNKLNKISLIRCSLVH